MLINFSALITDLGGKPIKDGDIDMTLKDLAVNALITTLTDARGEAERLSGIEKVGNATLAEKIYKSEEPIDLSVEDIAKLKERISRFPFPLVVMRAWSLLDPPA